MPITALTHEDCLENGGPTACSGEVLFRESLTGTGTRIERCDRHWEARLVKEDEIRNRYPEQAPRDFDPAYAGERWDDDY
jgi:hypothetical protein